MTLADDLGAVDRADIAKLKRERDRYKADLKAVETEAAELRQLVELATEVEGRRTPSPPWASPKKASAHHGTVMSLFSDWHWDEVVQPDQIDRLNAYNRRIAEKRLQRYFEHLIVLARDYVSGITYDGVTLLAAGDNFTGEIHEELKRTNEAELVESIEHYLDPVVCGLRLLAEEFGRVHVSAVAGNHGRLPDKRRSPAKFRAQSNVDYLFWRLVARDFRGDDRLTFDVPKSADTLVDVYGHGVLLTHGDQFRGGSGIAGVFSPLMLGHHRKTRRQAASNKPYQVMAMGHFHTYISAASQGILVNGSGKGVDEYSWVSNFSIEAPTQAFWIATPEYGHTTFHAPIHVANRRSEGW